MTDDRAAPGRSGQTTGGGQDWRRFLTFKWLMTGALVVVVGLWLASTIGAYAAEIDFEGLDHPYALLFGFVAFDAVIPIFPSESLLNSASTLVAQGNSNLEIWRLIIAGALGAIVGDSALYWLSRTGLRTFMADRVEQAAQNEKVGQSLRLLEERAGMLIVFGRFVPGVRFVVGATMGLTRYSYWRFLAWGSLGSVSWAVHLHLLVPRGLGHRRSTGRFDARVSGDHHRLAHRPVPTVEAWLGGSDRVCALYVSSARRVGAEPRSKRPAAIPDSATMAKHRRSR